MEVEKTLRPGAHGTAKYLNRFGDRLVCVRHRLDRNAEKRYTTVELILDERPILPVGQRHNRPGPDDICQLSIKAHETSLRKLVREHGGVWDSATRTWRLYPAEVEACCLWDRVVGVITPNGGR